ncbi:hypothetical protein W97_09173 [Coniosporium apollinis CBS 100218]|uniref:MalT-like TPR region domain-containing protein n=1 Tax=Coniosporium apollinis (strain CBS 100218) TaxID=1168221 RepID=R7Z7B3_CONA1|nr:uncharacterized protein W97_09173 [Coniosporium apollinis CBS 100218]EON69909.1 hypothetical protein W97_09173 [Coniosporium apollinis CBS 100218]
MQGDQIDATIEGFQALYSRANTLQVFRLAGFCAIQLSIDYAQRRDWDKSVEWGQRALDIAEEYQDCNLGSEAAKSIILSKRERLRHSPYRSGFEELINFLITWAEKNRQMGNVENQMDKYGLLSNVEILRANRFEDVEKREASRRCLAWLEQAEGLVNLLPEREQTSAIAEIKFKSFYALLLLDQRTAAIETLRLAHLLFQRDGKHREAQKMLTIIS